METVCHIIHYDIMRIFFKLSILLEILFLNCADLLLWFLLELFHVIAIFLYNFERIPSNSLICYLRHIKLPPINIQYLSIEQYKLLLNQIQCFYCLQKVYVLTELYKNNTSRAVMISGVSEQWDETRKTRGDGIEL